MPEYVTASIVAFSGLASQVIARIRCLWRPETGCISGCTEHSIQKEPEHEITCQKFDLHGQEVLVLSATT